MNLLERKWLLLPWAVVAVFAFFAATDDYARFKMDKSAQQQALAESRRALSKAADSWIEEARIVIEQYRTEEERRSIEKDLMELAAKSAQAQEALRKIPAAAFFPETLRAEENLADRIGKFEEITRGAFEAKTDLLNAQAEMDAAPLRIQYYRRQSHYFWTIHDILNFYQAQEALAQSETSQREIVLTVQDLQSGLDEWQERLDFERMASLDDLTTIDDSLTRESGMDYSTYIKARMRSFNAWRAIHRV
jgi:hypothetical protein